VVDASSSSSICLCSSSRALSCCIRAWKSESFLLCFFRKRSYYYLLKLPTFSREHNIIDIRNIASYLLHLCIWSGREYRNWIFLSAERRGRHDGGLYHLRRLRPSGSRFYLSRSAGDEGPRASGDWRLFPGKWDLEWAYFSYGALCAQRNYIFAAKQSFVGDQNAGKEGKCTHACKRCLNI